MTIFQCNDCGTSYPDGADPPAECRICTDERQYLPVAGHSWTTREALAEQHQPRQAFGQRAFLLRTPAGSVLWDCIALLDKATEALVPALGGVAAIAISHPHYYTTMQDWAEAFEAPIFLHEANRDWVVRPHPSIRFWEGEAREILPEMTLICAGGHCPDCTVLHWAEGAGTLLARDVLQVTPSTGIRLPLHVGRWVATQRSQNDGPTLRLVMGMVRGIEKLVRGHSSDRESGSELFSPAPACRGRKPNLGGR